MSFKLSDDKRISKMTAFELTLSCSGCGIGRIAIERSTKHLKAENRSKNHYTVSFFCFRKRFGLSGRGSWLSKRAG